METVLFACLSIGGLGAALAWLLLLHAPNGSRRPVRAWLGTLPLIALGGGVVAAAAYAQRTGAATSWVGYVVSWNVAALVLGVLAVRRARGRGRPTTRAKVALGAAFGFIFVASFLALDAMRCRELDRRREHAAGELLRLGPAPLAPSDDARADWIEVQGLSMTWRFPRLESGRDAEVEEADRRSDLLSEPAKAVRNRSAEVAAHLADLAPLFAAADRALAKSGFTFDLLDWGDAWAVSPAQVRGVRDIFALEALQAAAVGDVSRFRRGVARIRGLAAHLARTARWIHVYTAVEADARVTPLARDALALAGTSDLLPLAPSRIDQDLERLFDSCLASERHLSDRSSLDALEEGDALRTLHAKGIPPTDTAMEVWRRVHRVFLVPDALEAIDRRTMIGYRRWLDEAAARRASLAALLAADEATVRYREREGHYPESLEALVPRDLAAVPTDAYEGSREPFGYERRVDGAVIWSRADDQRRGLDWRSILARSPRGRKSAHVFFLGDIAKRYVTEGAVDEPAGIEAAGER